MEIDPIYNGVNVFIIPPALNERLYTLTINIDESRVDFSRIIFGGVSFSIYYLVSNIFLFDFHVISRLVDSRVAGSVSAFPTNYRTISHSTTHIISRT